ncbi:MAG: DUF1326 domain-containing protein [Armatimonadetes bacterium]|nr:DUF1326 domain-containing protein [Armatimonadota bacterium]
MNKRMNACIKVLVAVIATMPMLTALATEPGQPKTWSIKADYIEACSCSAFCSCYFNTGPEGGMMCEFNNAVKIAQGHVGDVKLDGKKFWLSGDLGGDFTKGMKSAVVTFDTGTSQAEKDAIMYLIQKVYPVTWKEVNMDEAPITWEKSGMNGHAKLGDKGEVVLEGIPGPDGKQARLDNVKYWGAQKNSGFYLAYGTHHYKGFGHDYSLEKRNGFFIHIESEGNVEN